jgi:diadenosine tetraphosphatase ApaH/serine/threonine PP2A family protein phosphatase
MGLLLALVASSLYSYWRDYRQRADRWAREQMHPPENATCRIWLERTAAERPGGAAANAGPASPLGPAGAAVPDVQGAFVRMNDAWVVLRGETDPPSEWWIPRQRILALECSSGP